jgi:hypothetical protein
VSHILHLMQVGLQEAYALTELVELDALSVVVRNKFRKQLDSTVLLRTPKAFILAIIEFLKFLDCGEM